MAAPSASVKAEGAELFKRGITLQKLGDSSAGKFERSGAEGDGVQAAAQYAQAAELLALALDSGAYEGAVRGTLAKKRDAAVGKLDGLRAKIGEGAAQRAEGEAKQELAKWQASRGATAERDAFKLAIEVLKRAAQNKALLVRGDESKRPDAVRLFTEGAALLAEAIETPKSEKVKVAMEKKLLDVKATIVELGGSMDAEDLPSAPAKSRPNPRRKSGSGPPPNSKRGSFSEPARGRSRSRSLSSSSSGGGGGSRSSSRSVTPPAIPPNVAGKSPRSSFSGPAEAPKPKPPPEPESAPEPEHEPEPQPEVVDASAPAEDRSIPDNVDEMRPFQLKKELRMRRLEQSGTKEELAQRLKDYAAGKISPPELEKTPEQVASALIGCTLRALKAPPLKAASDEKSARAGNLKKGEEVIVTEYAVLNPSSDAPVIRLRCDKGWFNLNNKKGEPLLENLGMGKTPVKLPAKPKPKQPQPQPPEPAPAPSAGAGPAAAAPGAVATPTAGSASGSPIRAGAAAARAASTNPFKESVPILKDAAAADACVRKGDESAAPQALKLYRQGLALLEEAIADPQFKAGVKAAMRKRIKTAGSRVAALEKIVGTSATGDAGMTTPADSTVSRNTSAAAADEWQAHMDAAAAAGRLAASEAASDTTPVDSPSHAKSSDEAAAVTAAKSAPGVDPFKASIPLLKAAAASDARVKKGDVASAPEAMRLYREGVSLLMEACESPKYNEKVKAAMGKRLSVGKDRLVQLAKICEENDVLLSSDELTSRPSGASSGVGTVSTPAPQVTAAREPQGMPPEPESAIQPTVAAPAAHHVRTPQSPASSQPPAPVLGLSGDMLRQAAEQAAASRTVVAEQAEARWAAAQEARKAKSESLAAARAEAAAQSAAAMAEATEAEAQRQAEQLRNREAAMVERQAARAAANAARQADLEARKAERQAAAKRHEEAAAARQQKREQAAASAAAIAAAGQSKVSGDDEFIDWSGTTASLAIGGLLGPLRTAMAAANVRRPLEPLSFIAEQLHPGAGTVASGVSNENSGSAGAIDAFAYIESYETELIQAMQTCVVETESQESASSRSASQATRRLAELLNES